LGGGSRLRNGAAQRVLTERGRTTVTLGQSPARRRGSGGGKPARQTPGRWGKHAQRSGVDKRDERRAGEKNSAGGRQLCFKGEQRGGGGWVGAVWRQSGRERGREVGATVEDGGVGATWDGVADRWAGTRRGPGHQRPGAA
jgi:hypothetical protein